MNQTSIMKEKYEDHYILAIQWLESVIRKFSRFDVEDETNENEVSKH